MLLQQWQGNCLSTSDVITGADLSGGMVDIGGISSIAGQANFDLSASSTNVVVNQRLKLIQVGNWIGWWCY